MSENEDVIYLKSKGDYLDSSISELPINAIIYKKVTGIGATTLEINSKRNSIIIEPNTPVIEGKSLNHKDLLGVYEGIKTSDIIDYLQNNTIQYKKLITTPESFEKIKRACYMLDIDIYKDYFLLFDECHKLTSDIDFRESISLPMIDFWKFEKRSLISATITNFSSYPIFKKYNFKSITIEPKWHHAQKVNLYTSNNILQDIKHCLQTLNNNEDSKFCFFINSVNIIISIIEALGIKNESSIFCAKQSISKLERKGFSNVFDSVTELNKYNFYTSRFFSAVDIISNYKPHVMIVSDAVKAPQTLIEPLLESRQIVGRFRKGISSFTHIAGLDNNIQSKRYKELQSYLEEQAKAFQQLKTLYDSAAENGAKQVMKEALERVEISKYLEEDGSFNYFMTENLLDTESAKAKYRTWQDFVLSYSIDDEFFTVENQNNNQYDINEEKFKEPSNNNRLLRKEIVDIYFDSELDKGLTSQEQRELLDSLKLQDEFIVEICQNFPKDFIVEKKYNKQQLSLALIKKKSDEKLISFPVIDAVYASFKIGISYTEEEIVRIFKRIYEELKIERTIKSTDIKQYFETSPRKTIKRKDVYKKGYKLLKIKFINKRTK